MYSASLGGPEARPIATVTGTRKHGRKLQLAPDTDIVALRPGGGLA
ncbi:MAG TPA: hypothetical protein VN737_17800 [Bryobacteraceae bacterium]|nr:hypothetical protein [Bryobacteraceae bacterium]